MTRGILAAAGYIPHHRLDRGAAAAVFGGAAGKGTRAVASYDEDTTTMGVEAARLALRGAAVTPGALWFSTATPAYLDKTNATAVHAATRLDDAVPAVDFGGALRSGVGALVAALDHSRPVLAVSSDIRVGLPTSPDETGGGDAAAAVLVGSDADGPLVAEHLATASLSAEFLDRWRAPGDLRSRTWEERFGETQYVPLGERAWKAALEQAGFGADAVTRAVVVSSHQRAASVLAKQLGREADPLAAAVGYAGAAAPTLALAAMVEAATPGDVIALVSLADGADVLIFRVTDTPSPTRSIASQIDAGAPVPYGKFLSWRGLVTVQPPNRPEPARPSAPAAARNVDGKFAFGTLADERATIASFTIDRLVYSPSPPVVFAVLDFATGDRLACELTDVDPEAVRAGDTVEMTFRRLFTADGVHNYFWKARVV